MAKTIKHGRNGRLWLAAANGGSAAPVEGKTKYTVNMSTDKVDVTSFGDTSKTTLAGLPDGSVDIEGFYDFNGDVLITAALDGLARKWYLYPDTTDMTDYFFGTATVDATFDGSVSGAINVKGTLSPTTPTCVAGLT